MVHKERVRKWVKALRSGKYEQGREQLRVDDKYCCLGVACDVSGLGEWKSSFSWQSYVIGSTDFSSTALPEAVLEYYDLSNAIPDVKYEGELKSLTYLNDKSNLPFSKIADLIEQTYLAPEETNGDLIIFNSNWINNEMAIELVPAAKEPAGAST